MIFELVLPDSWSEVISREFHSIWVRRGGHVFSVPVENGYIDLGEGDLIPLDVLKEKLTQKYGAGDITDLRTTWD